MGTFLPLGITMLYRISVEFDDNFVIAIVGWTMGNGQMIAENCIICGMQYFAVQYRFALSVCLYVRVCASQELS